MSFLLNLFADLTGLSGGYPLWEQEVERKIQYLQELLSSLMGKNDRVRQVQDLVHKVQHSLLDLHPNLENEDFKGDTRSSQLMQDIRNILLNVWWQLLLLLDKLDELETVILFLDTIHKIMIRSEFDIIHLCLDGAGHPCCSVDLIQTFKRYRQLLTNTHVYITLKLSESKPIAISHPNLYSIDLPVVYSRILAVNFFRLPDVGISISESLVLDNKMVSYNLSDYEEKHDEEYYKKKKDKEKKRNSRNFFSENYRNSDFRGNFSGITPSANFARDLAILNIMDEDSDDSDDSDDEMEVLRSYIEKKRGSYENLNISEKFNQNSENLDSTNEERVPPSNVENGDLNSEKSEQGNSEKGNSENSEQGNSEQGNSEQGNSEQGNSGNSEKGNSENSEQGKSEKGNSGNYEQGNSEKGNSENSEQGNSEKGNSGNIGNSEKGDSGNSKKDNPEYFENGSPRNSENLENSENQGKSGNGIPKDGKYLETRPEVRENTKIQEDDGVNGKNENFPTTQPEDKKYQVQTPPVPVNPGLEHSQPRLFGWGLFHSALLQIHPAKPVGRSKNTGVASSREALLAANENKAWLNWFSTWSIIFLYTSKEYVEHVEKMLHTPFLVPMPGRPLVQVVPNRSPLNWRQLLGHRQIVDGFLYILQRMPRMTKPIFSASMAMLHCEPVLINYYFRIVFSRTVAYDFPQVVATLVKVQAWLLEFKIMNRPLPSNFDWPYFCAALDAILSTDHHQLVNRTLQFLYESFDIFAGDVRRLFLTEFVLKKYFYKLFLHWDEITRNYFQQFLIFKAVRLKFSHLHGRKPLYGDVPIIGMDNGYITCEDMDPDIEVNNDYAMYGKIQCYLQVVQDQIQDPELNAYDKSLQIYARRSLLEYQFFISKYRSWEVTRNDEWKLVPLALLDAKSRAVFHQSFSKF